MKIKRLVAFGVALLLSLSSLMVVVLPTAYAAAQNCQWTGTAGDHKFSTAGNWSSCGAAAPLSGDNLIFDNTAVTDLTPNNDMVGASFGLITFQGTSTTGYAITGNSFTLTGGITDSSNSSQAADVISNPITISGAQTMTVTATNTLLGLSGALTGAGNITKVGNGALLLSADNSPYTGLITVNAGNLWAGSRDAIGAPGSAGATINNGADFALVGCSNLIFDGNLTLTGNSSIIVGDFPNPKLGITVGGCAGGGSAPDEEYGGPASSAVVSLGGAITLGSDVTFAATSATTTLTGTLSGAHKITMLSGYTGSLVINSSSNTSQTPNGTYTSPTFSKTLSDNQPAHTVRIDGNNIITIDGQRGATTVMNGGTLKGNGTIGALNVQSGGTVAPGHSPGCINSGNLSLNGTYHVDIGGTTACSGYNQINVTGTVDVTGATLDPSLFGGFTPSKGQSFTIINNDGSDPVTGTFANLAEGATFTLSNYVFKISYKGGDGNDVVLTVQATPTSPNTGFRLVTGSPLMTMMITFGAAAAIAYIAFRYDRLGIKR